MRKRAFGSVYYGFALTLLVLGLVAYGRGQDAVLYGAAFCSVGLTIANAVGWLDE